MANARSLLLSPECPYPLQGGGPMRTGSLLHYLSEHSSVDLISFHQQGSPDCSVSLPAGLCASQASIELPRHSKAYPAKLFRNGFRLFRRTLPLIDRFSDAGTRRKVHAALTGKQWDIGIIEHLWCVRYFDELRSLCRRVVLDLHNIESELHRSCAATERLPECWAHARFCTLAQEIEQEYLPKFDLILVTSESDRERVLSLAPDANVSVYPNTIPLAEPPAATRSAETKTDSIAFSGNLEYHPNVQALNYFRADIWPILKKEHPGLTWRIIGKNSGRVRAWARDDKDIEVTGPVENALDELAKSKIVVVPLLAGSGTRVKIIEAWAASCAVVSTPIGAEGLPARDGENLKIVRSPAQWVKAVLELLSNQAAGQRLGQNGRMTYELECSWPAAWKTLERPFAEICPELATKGVG